MKNLFKKRTTDPLGLWQIELVHALRRLTEQIPKLIEVMTDLDENVQDLARQVEEFTKPLV